MIKICKPYLKDVDTKTRCNCDIFFDGEKKTLWFEVDKKYSEFLCTERGDAYLIGLLHYAMQNNQDLEFEVPITEDLLYNIEKTLIPSLTNYATTLNKISIKTEIAPPLMEGKYNGTGCSCGIDSFSAIYNHNNTKYNSLDITHVCINNVGAFNDCYKKYGVEKVKEERYIKTREVSKYIEKELVETDSNYQEIIKENHFLTHTYSSVFAIYMLQKFWRNYYYASSGLDYSHFNIIDNDKDGCSHYELLSLQCFSIPGLRIYSEGGEKTRYEKTKEIVDFMPARKYLHVCLNQSFNCNICSKCKRTLTTLDSLEKLDNFKDVFDIDYYKKNKIDYYKWLYEQHVRKDLMNEPVYQELKKSKEFKKKMFFYFPLLFLKGKTQLVISKLRLNSFKVKTRK